MLARVHCNYKASVEIQRIQECYGYQSKLHPRISHSTLAQPIAPDDVSIQPFTLATLAREEKMREHANRPSHAR